MAGAGLRAAEGTPGVTWDIIQQLLLGSLLGLAAFRVGASLGVGRQLPVGPEGVPENVDVVHKHLLTEDPVHCVSDLPAGGERWREGERERERKRGGARERERERGYRVQHLTTVM